MAQQHNNSTLLDAQIDLFRSVDDLLERADEVRRLRDRLLELARPEDHRPEGTSSQCRQEVDR